MQVILLEKIVNLGGLGDVVRVKDGFARNFLIPQGKAVPANKANKEACELRRAELEAAAVENLTAAQTRAEAMRGLSVTIVANAGDEGKLFGSIGTKDIVHALAAAGHTVDKSEVKLSEGVLRNVGTYAVVLQLHSDVSLDVNVQVEAE